jgi:hypothetical protein
LRHLAVARAGDHEIEGATGAVSRVPAARAAERGDDAHGLRVKVSFDLVDEIEQAGIGGTLPVRSLVAQRVRRALQIFRAEAAIFAQRHELDPLAGVDRLEHERGPPLGRRRRIVVGRRVPVAHHLAVGRHVIARGPPERFRLGRGHRKTVGRSSEREARHGDEQSRAASKGRIDSARQRALQAACPEG